MPKGIYTRTKPSYRKGGTLSELHKHRISIAHKGKKKSAEHIANLRMVDTSNRSGSHHWNWQGGISFNNYKYVRDRRKRKYQAGGNHTDQEWEELKSKYGYMCLCCKRFEPEIKLTRDHILPISLGGSDNIENIQPLCRQCNSSKWNKNINYSCKLS